MKAAWEGHRDGQSPELEEVREMEGNELERVSDVISPQKRTKKEEPWDHHETRKSLIMKNVIHYDNFQYQNYTVIGLKRIGFEENKQKYGNLSCEPNKKLYWRTWTFVHM